MLVRINPFGGAWAAMDLMMWRQATILPSFQGQIEVKMSRPPEMSIQREGHRIESIKVLV